MFATASRDKTIKIWKSASPTSQAGSPWSAIATIKLPEAVTAVEFAPALEGREGREKEHVLAAGLEDGRVFLFRCDAEKPEVWAPLGEVSRELTHVGTVNGLAWRLTKGENLQWQLASCGVDHSVRLFNINLK
ncbi:hypothetical protein BGZ95_010210 [Linnemannia exigua]|uniref:Elongator complex protein 2 n=1 Tax=Linnemannia exigua TaxID=604196 RepID=A0AAD4DDS2_9FUNG|nr:hypothetical protein BGZ95_010210 [Linnemannia exigua]